MQAIDREEQSFWPMFEYSLNLCPSSKEEVFYQEPVYSLSASHKPQPVKVFCIKPGFTTDEA